MLARCIRQSPGDECFPRLPWQVIEFRFVADADLNRLAHKDRSLPFRPGLLVGQSDRYLWVIGVGSALVDEDGQHVGACAEVEHIVVATGGVGGYADTDLPVDGAEDVVAMGRIFQKEDHRFLDSAVASPEVLAGDQLPAVPGPGGVAGLRDALLGSRAIGSSVGPDLVSCQVIGVTLRCGGQ